MNAHMLKIIALVSMVIDHIGCVLNALYRYNAAGAYYADTVSDAYWPWRLVGRLAFPIFAFLIAEGCAHTRDLKKYILRLGLFALISQIPYQIFINLQYAPEALLRFTNSNVLVTLCLGAAAVYCYRKSWEDAKYRLAYVLGILAAFAAVILRRGEYDIGGLAIILLVYALRPKTANDPDARIHGSYIGQALACTLAAFLYYSLFLHAGVFELAAVALSGIPLLLYTGKPGSRRGKWGFYAFYPAHLLALSLVMLLVIQI